MRGHVERPLPTLSSASVRLQRTLEKTCLIKVGNPNYVIHSNSRTATDMEPLKRSSVSAHNRYMPTHLN